MSNAFLITIDLELLAEHFAATDDKLWTPNECKEWLEETGFRKTDDNR